MTTIFWLVYAVSVLFMAWCFLTEVLQGDDKEPVMLAEVMGTLSLALFPGLNTLSCIVILSGLSDVVMWNPHNTKPKI